MVAYCGYKNAQSAQIFEHQFRSSALIRSYDWAKTPVGPIDRWPSILKMTTALILQSPISIVTLWGTDGVMIYNDAYSRFGGARHPGLLGRNVREAWPEVADFTAMS